MIKLERLGGGELVGRVEEEMQDAQYVWGEFAREQREWGGARVLIFRTDLFMHLHRSMYQELWGALDSAWRGMRDSLKISDAFMLFNAAMALPPSRRSAVRIFPT